MISAIICYLATLIIIGGAFYGLLFFMKKFLSAKWSGVPFFGGIILSIAYFAGMVLLFMVTFSNEQYYNTSGFKLVVGFAFLLLLSFARYLIIKLPFFNRDHDHAGYSMCLGLGIAPGALIGAYCLIMLVGVVYNGIFYSPCDVMDNGLLVFSDGTSISTFQPIEGHIAFGIWAMAYASFNIVFAWYIHKLTKKMYRPVISGGIGLVLMILDALLVLSLVFIIGIGPWALAILGVVCAALGFLMVRYMPERKKEEAYIKQFD